MAFEAIMRQRSVVEAPSVTADHLSNQEAESWATAFKGSKAHRLPEVLKAQASSELWSSMNCEEEEG